MLVMKYLWDGESKACYCQREARAEPASFSRSEKSEFSSQLRDQCTLAVPKREKAGTCAMQIAEQLCLPSAVGSLEMALQILYSSESSTFEKLGGD